MKVNFDDTLLDVSSNGKVFILTLGEQTIQAEILNSENGKLDLLIDGKRATAYVSSENDKRWVTVNGQTFVLTKTTVGAPRGRRGHQHAAGELTAPMPGQIRAVNVSEGDMVAKGQTLLVVEAMKMEIRVQAQRDGVVKKLFIKQGQTVEREQVLIEMEE